MGNWKLGIGNGELGIGNGELGIGKKKAYRIRILAIFYLWDLS
jgi:hypothetical protein